MNPKSLPPMHPGLLAAGLLLALAIGFLWLTPWRYDHLVGAYSTTTLARTHRLTGASEYLNPREGWRPAGR